MAQEIAQSHLLSSTSSEGLAGETTPPPGVSVELCPVTGTVPPPNRDEIDWNGDVDRATSSLITILTANGESTLDTNTQELGLGTLRAIAGGSYMNRLAVGEVPAAIALLYKESQASTHSPKVVTNTQRAVLLGGAKEGGASDRGEEKDREQGNADPTQQQMNLPVLKLKQDVKTRWNSTFDMLQRIVQVKAAVIATVALQRSDLSIKEQDWEIIEGVLPLLKPFYEITVEISAEKNVTLSKVIVFCNLLKSFLQRHASNNEKVVAVQSALKKGMEDRFKDIENNILYAECTILDPRFRQRVFKNQRACEVALQGLRHKIGRVQLIQQDIPEPVPNPSEISASSSSGNLNKEESIWDEYDKEINKIIRPDNQSAAGIRELDKYLNKEYLDRKKDLLQWWHDRHYSPLDSDSEQEDCLVEDDVRSDNEDAMVDFIEDTSPTSRQDDPENHVASLESTNLEVTSSTSHRIITLPQRSIRGKNNHVWSTTKGRTTGRTSAINIIRTNRGPTRMCRNVFDPLLCFQLFITDEIVDEIVKWTNVEMIIKRQNLKEISASYRDTNAMEVWSLIGILTLTAVMKDNHLSTDELFDASFSGTRYVSVMSRERFEFLLRCLRMDDKSLRPTLRSDDAFVPVRNIWEIFINQCRLNYVPGSNLTVDEQLLGFRGRCPFRMYIPNKPDKYGIKFPMMCDASTKYMIDAIPYLGKSTKTNGLPLGEFYVKELTKTVHGTNRNVTCDNWFTSVPLAKNLLQTPYNLTIVGTIRSNKREIPEEIKTLVHGR
ncbi:unnamed protein product [Arctia plantaginis]|uniref:PiggyBac transposable element-derived protein domain-containing protein n=1 Tax=Arctia plantaginis TaxID=874455 RepID=A0A8S0ZG45_ARCPL|nr:unnamed protein product [Arctia plantaginis]